MRGVWLRGQRCLATGPDGRLRRYTLSAALEAWQFRRARWPRDARPFTLLLDDEERTGRMEGKPDAAAAA